ncbi:MAG: hypothetical protein J3Q66DRAFT_321680 [Benniella sp.]|nr:MAG: hypothetical protein J3Q66DRAFT_321680 [Benniella sp.]
MLQFLLQLLEFLHHILNLPVLLFVLCRLHPLQFLVSCFHGHVVSRTFFGHSSQLILQLLCHFLHVLHLFLMIESLNLFQLFMALFHNLSPHSIGIFDLVIMSVLKRRTIIDLVGEPIT